MVALCYSIDPSGAVGAVMSMHLVGPYLTTTNTKKRQNPKFKSAAAKARFLAEQAEWAKTMKKHGIDPAAPKSKQTSEPYRPERTVTRNTATVQTETFKHGIVPGVCAKPEPKVYTGTKLLGIATMHKSNMVPIFKKEDAEEIARMRR